MIKKTNHRATYTITAALPYANGPIHIGHMAGVYLPADIYARYQRKKNREVVFICGSDEGGAAITLAAKKQGISPQQLVDTYHEINHKTLENIGISFDIFSRTSAVQHHQIAQDFFLQIHKQGILEVKEQEQYYDPVENLFLADRYIQGTCPTCSYLQAYGDQCEKCGSTLSPDELLDPKSMVSGVAPIKKRTQHWYLPLDKYETWLKKWILEEQTTWKSNVYGQCKSWLAQGLHPRAITRDLNWGIPVPLAKASDKVLYVWFEAPIAYISATQIWANKQGKDWKHFWKNPNTKLIHFAGKDNIVFHCLIFPVMLKAHGGYILPHNVPANEFMNLAGKKISTSRNHAIWLDEYARTYPGQEDVLRYVLCACAPETKDSNFTWENFKTKNNHELVANLGNFIHRTISLIHKYFQGKVPQQGSYQSIDKEVLKRMQTLPDKIAKSIESFRFREALNAWMELARVGNKYLADSMPWKCFKEQPERTGTILYIGSQLMAQIAWLGEPFLPFTSSKLQRMLNLPSCSWDGVQQGSRLPEGHVFNEPYVLFKKI